jgi:hypothetical protein
MAVIQSAAVAWRFVAVACVAATLTGCLYDTPANNATAGNNRLQGANSPPTISGTPATSVQPGQAYQFAPVASDVDGNALAYSIVNRPDWASFSTTTGQLSGTPAITQVGKYAKIAISVSDGKATTSLAAFDIQVTSVTASSPTNVAPTLSGTPATAVVVGSAYSFAPLSADANNDALTFNIQNKPPWASFNLTNGQLTGTPSSSNVGTYANIVISVGDGQSAAILPAFAITVTQTNGSTGSANLSWTQPTVNADGSALTDLAGYTLYYGTDPAVMSQAVRLGSPGQTAYMVTGLGSGTWYFTVRSFNTAGSESEQSVMWSKTI